MKKLAATLLAACLLCGGLMTGVLADTWGRTNSTPG